MVTGLITERYVCGKSEPPRCSSCYNLASFRTVEHDPFINSQLASRNYL